MTSEHIVLLVGGVGGAKLAYGLAKVLPPEALTIIVNTADDFEHLGLHVSPDLDTVMYTLSGHANRDRGWGVEGDTFRAMEMVHQIGGPAWFNLGDADLGTNLMRTLWLHQGASLSEVTRRISKALEIAHTILPMSNDPIRTILETDIGKLDFQEYFVREQWQPAVSKIEFAGAQKAAPADGIEEALHRATAIVIGPSNPFLSIDPILSIAAIRGQIINRRVPCIAVSPIIGGEAVKGPAAKLMTELSYDVSPLGVVHHYGSLIDGIILDEADSGLQQAVQSYGLRSAIRHTLMTTPQEKTDLASSLLHWLRQVEFE